MNRTYSLEKSPLYRMRNKAKLAKLLCLSDKHFRVFRVYGYNEFSKPKPDGSGRRYFMDPKEELKKIQKKICGLMGRIEVPKWVKSAQKGESYITNCKAHINSNYVLTMDISKFYDNASKKYVYKLFDATFKMEKNISAIMVNLLMNGEKFPTGGPASQIVIFWAYREMFYEIEKLARTYDCKFTLYVDDMTFSAKNAIPNKLQIDVIKILNRYGLSVKKEKSCYYQPGKFVKITGCGINGKGEVKVPNFKRKKLVNQFILCKKSKDIKEIERLKGMLCAVRQIEPDIFPSIKLFLDGYSSELKEYARARQKKQQRQNHIGRKHVKRI